MKLILLQIIFLILSASGANAYTGNGATHRNYPGNLISKDFPNQLVTSVSLLDSISYRIEPHLIQGFNEKTTRIEIIASIDPPQLHGNSSLQFPLFVSIEQRHEHMLMQLPYTFNNKQGQSLAYYSASRTICFPQTHTYPDDHANDILVKVSTGSATPINFKIKVLVRDDLVLSEKLGKARKFRVSPTDPKFLFFPWINSTIENVVLKISSNNTDCMAVAVQEPSCPVFHVDDNFAPGNDWEIFSQNASIEIDMKKYMKGFYVKTFQFRDDILCGKIGISNKTQRNKEVTILVENNEILTFSSGHFLLAIIFPPIFSLIIGLISMLIYSTSYAITRKRMVICRTQFTSKAGTNAVSCQKFSLVRKSRRSNYGKWLIFISLFFIIPIVEQSIYNALISKEAVIYGVCSNSDLCSHPLWIFKDFNHLWSNICYIILGICFLLITQLKKCFRKRSDQDEGIQFYSGLYYAMGWAIIIKGIASAIYHYCPSKSNFQYDIAFLSVIVGICILKLIELRRPKCIDPNTACGMLIICFLVSSLGVSFERYVGQETETFFIFRITIASIQGIFLFYASIYIIYIGYPINRYPKAPRREEIPLQQMVISELRHKQTTIATATTSTAGAKTASQTKLDAASTPVVPPPQEDYMKSIGDIPRFLWIFPKIWHWKLPTCRVERILFMILFLTLNGSLIYYSLSANYCLYLLVFLASNFGLNILFYFIMKIVFGEFSCKWKSIQVFFYVVLAIGFTVTSGLFFWMNVAEWSEPATHARAGDEECLFPGNYGFYDKHDAWHMLSAHALFFIFMIILSVDDGVEGIDREYLLVF